MITDAQSKSTASRSHPVLALTMGDMNGIGPEILLKILSGRSNTPYGVLLFASRKVMNYYAGIMNTSPCWEEPAPMMHVEDSGSAGSTGKVPEPRPGEVFLISDKDPEEAVIPGTVSSAAGTLAMNSISSAVSACMKGRADALITSPISKEAIQKAGYHVPGHTEYLAQLTGNTKVGMMLVNDSMRIGLATIHIPLREVPDNLTPEGIEEQLLLFYRTLQLDFGISQPRIAVLGVNPHAGDGGVIGDEEQLVVEPVVKKLQKQDLRITGPWSADGFFGNRGHEEVDLVFAMYHDQGLVPLKLSGFGRGVNITAGLPIIRTSPDHGTAFSIAGKNRADAGSMQAAIDLARHILSVRSGK